MGLVEGRVTLLVAAVALLGAARGEPKPVVVQYLGGGTAPEQQPAAEGIRATALLQRDGGPRAGYFLPPRWYPVGPAAARRPEEGRGVPRGGGSDGRGYSLGQADGYRWEEAAPHFDASYNGIVRRAGIREDGRDYQGEPGVYAIRGGVFPGDYNAAQGDERAYVFRQPVHLPHEGAVGGPYALVRASGYPYVYNAAARSGPLGYSPEIQARGEPEREPEERRVYYVGRGEGDNANYVGVIVGRQQGVPGTGYNGDTGRFAEHQFDRGVDHQQHRQQFQPQQHQYAQRQPQEYQRRQEALYPVRQEEGEEDGAYREVRPAKVPVRGVAPRAFYGAEGGARGGESKRYN